MRRAQFGAWAPAILLPFLVGAQCNPTPPDCGQEQACGFAHSFPPEAGFVPVCLNFCAPTPDEPANARCTLDPCDEEAWLMGDIFMCPEGWSCQAEFDPVTGTYDPRFGRCAQNGFEPGQPCDPAGRIDMATPCTTGTFCRDLSECEEWPLLEGWAQAGATSTCYLPSREGERCDGNWSDPSACAPCEPGLTCTTTTDDEVPRCRRECEDPSVDCSCAVAGQMAECVEGPDGRWCDFCVATYAQCEDGLDCCDPSATCSVVAGVEMCCRGDAVTCAGVGECCPGLTCYQDECTGCIEFGNVFDALHPLGCCPGLEPREPAAGGPEQCLFPCNDVCRCGDGRTYDAVCTDRGSHCDPNDGYLAPDTDCDGEDEDCDGRVDEGYANAGDPCSGGTVPGHCAGWTFSGIYRCEDGVETCVPRPGIDYCGRSLSTSWSSGGAGCNWSGGDVCDDGGGSGGGYPPPANQHCSPGTACTLVASCTISPTGNCILCASIAGCGPEICWRPGETSQTYGGMCPAP